MKFERRISVKFVIDRQIRSVLCRRGLIRDDDPRGFKAIGQRVGQIIGRDADRHLGRRNAAQRGV